MARPSSGFINLQRYLGANTGNVLGSTIGRQAAQLGTDLESQVGSSVNKLREDVNQARLDSDQNKELRDKTLENVGTLIEPGQVSNVVTPDLINKFNTFQSGQFTGPTDIQDKGALLAKQDEIKQTLNELTQPGAKNKFSLLNKYVSSPVYTTGQKTLDSALLGQSNLKPYTQNLKQVPGSVERKLAEGQGAVASAKAGSEQFGKDTTKGITDKLTQIQSTIATRKNQAKTPEQALEEAKQQPFNSNKYGFNLSPRSTGSDPYYGVDPRNSLYASGLNPTEQNIATLPEYAQYDALNKLGGRENTLLTNPTEASKYDPNALVGFDTDPFLSRVATQKAAFEDALKSGQGQINLLNQAQQELLKAGISNISPSALASAAQDVYNKLMGLEGQESQNYEALKRLYQQYGQNYDLNYRPEDFSYLVPQPSGTTGRGRL